VLIEDQWLSFSHMFLFPLSFLFFPFNKNMLAIAKKNEEVWLFVCLVKLDPHSFNYNVFGLEFFVEFFFISSIDI